MVIFLHIGSPRRRRTAGKNSFSLGRSDRCAGRRHVRRVVALFFFRSRGAARRCDAAEPNLLAAAGRLRRLRAGGHIRHFRGRPGWAWPHTSGWAVRGRPARPPLRRCDWNADARAHRQGLQRAGQTRQRRRGREHAARHRDASGGGWWRLVAARRGRAGHWLADAHFTGWSRGRARQSPAKPKACADRASKLAARKSQVSSFKKRKRGKRENESEGRREGCFRARGSW